MKKSITHRHGGYSLLEMMIALVVGGFLLGGLITTFVSVKGTSAETDRYGAMQENGRFAISLLTEELIRGGFWGDLPGDLQFSALSRTPSTPGNDCKGDGLNNGSFPNRFGHFRALWGETVNSRNAIGCINDAKTNSDVIQVKRTISTPVQSSDRQADSYYLYSNFNSGEILSGMQSPTLDANAGRFWEYQHHIFYVTEETRNNLTVPVLMQGSLSNRSGGQISFEPMIDGIEVIHFLYGVDTSGDGVINGFFAADRMQDEFWDAAFDNRIMAIKIYVLVRDLKPDFTFENEDTYQLGDMFVDFKDANGKGDNYRRLLFSSTINLYNNRDDSWP